MSYQITFEQQSGYLHAIVTGENSSESVDGYLEELQRECSARGCTHLLLEERLEGPRLGYAEVYRIASQEGGVLVDDFPTIAFVDVFAVGTAMAFAGEVSFNRGIDVRVFASVDEARAWLRERIDAEAS